MKIIFIASLKSYTTAISLIKSFQNQQHDVVVLSDVESDYIQVNTIVRQNFNIDKYVEQNNLKPDLVFFCEGGSMKLFPQGLEELECKTAWYGIDTHMDLQKHLEIAKFFDITFLAQKEYIQNFKQVGIKNIFWLPLAYDTAMAPNEQYERIYDIAYVGSNNRDMHPVRFELIEKLKKEFPNSYFGRASGKEMYKIYSQAKIVFNKSINNDINMRYFEALGNGAMLLTDKVVNNGVEDIFEKNKHYIEYSELDIIDIAKKYLKKNIDNSTVLQEYIKSNHTYDIRSIKIVETVNSCLKVSKIIGNIDYMKVYLMLENFVALLEIFESIVYSDIIRNSKKRKLVFLPLLSVLVLMTLLLKKLGR